MEIILMICPCMFYLVVTLQTQKLSNDRSFQAGIRAWFLMYIP